MSSNAPERASDPAVQAGAAPLEPTPERGVTPNAGGRRAGPSPALWVNSTYFAEGLPYMIVRILSSVYFTDIGVKERYLGYLNFLAVPWNLKFTWAPWVDRFGSPRRWLTAMQLGIGLLTAGIGVLAFIAGRSADPVPLLTATSVLLVGMAFLAATNDVAIDANYLDGLPLPAEQAGFSGYRVLAYRASMVFARSGLVVLAAYAAGGKSLSQSYRGWGWAFFAGALTVLILGSLHGWLLPRFPRAGGAHARPSYVRAFLSYLQQERVALVLVFIAVYKLGDEILFSMTTPFLMRYLGVTKDQYAWIGGIVGAFGTILGAMLGGSWIRRVGLKRAIWPLTLLMNLNIWAYVWLAYARPMATSPRSLALIACVHGYEQIAAGLGSAVLLVYLLGTCKPEHKAAHYAVGSAIMSVGSSLVGGFGGEIVEKVGYLNLFLLAFAASLPSMLLLPFVPLRSPAGGPPANSSPQGTAGAGAR